MNLKSSLRQVIWVFIAVIAISIVLSSSMNSDFYFSNNFYQVELPSPQADHTYLRWGTGWGGVNTDFAEDIWCDEYYGYVCGTADIDAVNSTLTLARYSEWGWGFQDWNITWTDGTPTYGKAVWGNGYDIYTAGISTNNLVLIKWVNNGTQIWNTTWNLNGNFGDVHAIWGIDDAIYMSGAYIDDLLLIKWDNTGSQIWNRTWGGIGWEEGFDVWGVGDDIYTCGSTSSFGFGLNDSVIVKWDSDGNQNWNKTWGYTTEEYYTSIFGFNTSLYVCGNIWNDEHNATDMILLKYESDGNVIWNTSWGGPEDEKAYSIWANEFFVYVSTTTNSWGPINEKIVLMKWSYSGIYVDSSWPGWEDDYKYIPSGMFVYDQNVYICGWYNGSQEISGDIDQLLYNFYSYHTPPAPLFEQISPNPSTNGTYLLEWQYFEEVEYYHLYRDIHPILDISGRPPYQVLTNSSFIETDMDEGTYFYVVTSFVKNTESPMSNPRIVEVDLPEPEKKVPGYDVILVLTIIGFSSFWVYKNKVRKN